MPTFSTFPGLGLRLGFHRWGAKEKREWKTRIDPLDSIHVDAPAAAAPPAPLVVAANCLVKIRHRRKLPLNRPAKVITAQKDQVSFCHPPSFSSHLVASIDNLLVFSLLRANIGGREREREKSF